MRITAYGNLTDSSTQAQALINKMINEENYSPFDDFVCIRSGEREYYIFYGKAFEELGELHYIRYSSPSNVNNYTYTKGNIENVSFEFNNYTAVGTLENTTHSATIEQYKMSFVSIVMLIVISVITIFNTFRGKYNGNNRSYN